MARASLGIPQQCTAVAIIAGNAATQLTALAQAYCRADLIADIPILKQTGINAARLARDSLDELLKSLEAPEPTSKARRAKR